MRKVNPKNIKIGQYYIQEWNNVRLLKKRVKKPRQSRDKEIWGKVIKSNCVIFDINEIGYMRLDYSNPTKFYLLTEEEVFLELL